MNTLKPSSLFYFAIFISLVFTNFTRGSASFLSELNSSLADRQNNLQFEEHSNPWGENDQLFDTISAAQSPFPDPKTFTPLNNPFENYTPQSGSNQTEKILEDLQRDLNTITADDMLQPKSVDSQSLNVTSENPTLTPSSSNENTLLTIIIVVFVLIGIIYAVKQWLIMGAKLEERDVKNHRMTKSEAMSILREKKDLLDLGVISSEEYEKAKVTLRPYLLNELY